MGPKLPSSPVIVTEARPEILILEVLIIWEG